ncbi:hypothetical protein PIB30_000701 [Stylosanthes scabra]|uniref:Ribonuclease H1 N-terminal domain-containing protein n=1 Tax=Stylosanthes scabra TaxID=79078 RepID=A0ABU6YZE2_9FABA|nr:hypothetical protein [Stylosanthes scabra]
MSRAKYSHYTVRVGRNPGIYTDWDDCNEQVHGFPYASFRGFRSLEEAVEWMNKEPVCRKSKQAAKGVEKLSPDFYSKIGGGSYGSHAYEIPLFSTQFSASCSHGASGGNPKGKKTVETEPEPEKRGLIIEEEMEFYLLRVCTKLHYGSPKFERYAYLSQHGDQHYRFSAKLVCEEAGIKLEAHGCFSPNEEVARDDAAYNLLEMLLRCTGYSICDYNYRQVYALKQQLEDIHGSQGNDLARRLIEKEEEVERLTKQIQSFHDFLLM